MSRQHKSRRHSPDLLPILLLTLLILIVILGYAIINEYSHNKGSITETPESSASDTPAAAETSTADTATEQSKDTNAESTPSESSAAETTPGQNSSDDSIFKDSLFIGDSRTEGLHLFSGISCGTFYANTGLTVDQTDTVKFVKDGKSKKTVIQALKGKHFDKILIALGMNELGWPSVDVYIEKYQEMIQKIRKSQPDTPIYIQSIIQVTKEKSDSHEYMTKENVDRFNAALKKLADNETIFYIDVNPKLIDKNGYLKAEYSQDGVHLVFAKYEIWLQELIDYFNQP